MGKRNLLATLSFMINGHCSSFCLNPLISFHLSLASLVLSLHPSPSFGVLFLSPIEALNESARTPKEVALQNGVVLLNGAQGIDVSRPPLERPRKELDAAYFSHYCAMDEPGHPEPPPQQPRAHKRAPPPAQEPDEFAAYVAWLTDLAQEGDRADAVEASAMDVDDDDFDEE
ncbi:hypothetical protein LR48_Vigan1104s000200 [Vigna angularis]|uniref:Uncharacterized protein n=1 Tax=Phaseolus angularis TaxID=3914 RepID=A0A0L9TIK9_PHAAN|nr:hypothetical protein LR48_Vigan1104s000200 [Vigna angularis]